MVAEVEQRLELGPRPVSRSPRISRKQAQEIACPRQTGWRCAARGVGVPREAPAWVKTSSTRCEWTRPPSRSRFALHVLRVDDELLDHARQPVERKVERHRASGRSSARPMNARYRARARAPRSPWRGASKPAPYARDPSDFRQHRIALVRHRGGAFLALREVLLCLQPLSPLKMADLDGERSIDDATTASVAKYMRGGRAE